MGENCDTEGCEAAYLGPDIGYVNIYEYHDGDGSCTISMAELAAVCAEQFAECIAFLDSSDPSATSDPTVERFSATGWFLMTANASATAPGDDAQGLFIEFFRADISSAADVPFNYVSVLEVRAATDTEEGDTINVHVNYEVVAEGTEAAALDVLRELEAQAADPSSALLAGVVTNTITQAGDDPVELQLHSCEPIFLGPDIGFVNVMNVSADACFDSSFVRASLRF